MLFGKPFCCPFIMRLNSTAGTKAQVRIHYSTDWRLRQKHQFLELRFQTSFLPVSHSSRWHQSACVSMKSPQSLYIFLLTIGSSCVMVFLHLWSKAFKHSTDHVRIKLNQRGQILAPGRQNTCLHCLRTSLPVSSR